MAYDSEEGYKRFQDFGLVGGLMVVAFLVGLIPRQLFIGDAMALMITKIVVCGLLAVLLVPLLHCLCTDAPAPWMKPRTKWERTSAGTIVVVLGVLLGSVYVLM